MPKVKETKNAFFQRVSSDHPNIFRNDDSVLFCLMCDEKVNAEQYCQVTQHIKTGKHSANVQRKTKNGSIKKQSLLTSVPSSTQNSSSSEFAMDLTRAFLKSNIALHKLTNPSMVEFIEKHTKFAAPSETLLRLIMFSHSSIHLFMHFIVNTDRKYFDVFFININKYFSVF